MAGLSEKSVCLWAKKSRKEELTWLPLPVHMTDCSGVAENLWRSWLPEGMKSTICSSMQGQMTAHIDSERKMELARQLFLFIAAVHDLGKATPAFQSKIDRFHPLTSLDETLLDHQKHAGLKTSIALGENYRHALGSQLLLERFGCNRSVAAVLGAHHGKPVNFLSLENWDIAVRPEVFFFDHSCRPIWEAAQQEVLAFALNLSGFIRVEDLPSLDVDGQVLMSGLVIIADWIASREDCFPYFDIKYDWQEELEPGAVYRRAARGWARLCLPPCWLAEDGHKGPLLFGERFTLAGGGKLDPHPMQIEVARIAQDVLQPGILVIEAPMGQGKTEAALVAAEIYAHKAGRSGLFFALPTQATSDGMFSRIRAWASLLDPDARHSIRLSHGKAQFNKEYRSLFEGGSNVGIDEPDPLTVHPWFEGQKKSLLADFVVGTIDQLLMSALRQKHVMLRHVGLANKVVVIDECHAYDTYMNQYLERALNWLGAYGVPVVLMSATLPASKRQALVNAYLNGKAGNESGDDKGYPLITWSDGKAVCRSSPKSEEKPGLVQIGGIKIEEVPGYLTEQLQEGGCAGLLFNTVKRAQAMAQTLREYFGDAVELIHSRFIAPDRADKEVKLLEELGKPGRGFERPPLRIVVGTQVLEQSLDIDFDLMITDLCPMDLLLQRIGRLHRHERERSERLRQARCLVIQETDGRFEKGSEFVYGRYLLMRTRAFLPENGMIALPDDIPRLVGSVYDETNAYSFQAEEYEEAAREWELLQSAQREKAKRFRVASAEGMDEEIVGWLDLAANDSERAGEATVRDTDESIEVLLLQCGEGGIRFLPWQEGGSRVAFDTVLPARDAEALARQRIRLPQPLCSRYAIRKTIEELEGVARLFPRWQESPWLKGELFLILDESGTARLNGYRIRYSRMDGMTYEKEGN